MFSKKLSTILGAFTKAQAELGEFLTSNGSLIKETTSKLDTAIGEQAKAEKSLEQVNKILGE